MTKQLSILNARRSTSSQILCCVLVRSINIRNPTKLVRKGRNGPSPDQSYRDYDGINGEPTEFEWNIFPGLTTLQLCGKVTDLVSIFGETQETFTGRILFMSMFNDISCDSKGNKEECMANAKVVSILAEKFGIGQWSFLAPGSEKKWYSMEENSPQRIWDCIADGVLLEFGESGCPIFRATTPVTRGSLKSKGHGKLSIHFAADHDTIGTFFCIFCFANQLSLDGAVANMCEEHETHYDRSGQPDVLMGQSIIFIEIQAKLPLVNVFPESESSICRCMKNESNCFHKKIK